MNYSISTYLSLAALVATAILALVVVARYLDLKREEDEESEPADSPTARLAQLERAFYAGQMNREEFERIKQALEGTKPSKVSEVKPPADVPAPPSSPD